MTRIPWTAIEVGMGVLAAVGLVRAGTGREASVIGIFVAMGLIVMTVAHAKQRGK